VIVLAVRAVLFVYHLVAGQLRALLIREAKARFPVKAGV
jgi:hypothetical protein